MFAMLCVRLLCNQRFVMNNEHKDPKSNLEIRLSVNVGKRMVYNMACIDGLKSSGSRCGNLFRAPSFRGHRWNASYQCAPR
jgi:hypothetical protein